MNALRNLRVSVARIAQILDVDNDQLGVTGADYTLLCELAEQRECGWNDLAGRCVEKIHDQQRIHAGLLLDLDHWKGKASKTHAETQADAATRAEEALANLDYAQIEQRILAAAVLTSITGLTTGRSPEPAKLIPQDFQITSKLEAPRDVGRLTPEAREEMICALAGWVMSEPDAVLDALIYGRVGFNSYTDAQLVGAMEARGIHLKAKGEQA